METWAGKIFEIFLGWLRKTDIKQIILSHSYTRKYQSILRQHILSMQKLSPGR